MARRIVSSTAVVFVMFLVSSLSSLPAEAQKKGSAAAGKAARDTTMISEEEALEYRRPVFRYESKGKRDPFTSLAPETTAEGEKRKKIKGLFNYEGASLKGIVSAGDDTYALVVDSDGYGYVLRKGYRVFGGYVTDVTADAVHFHIVKYGRSMDIIMRLSSSKATVIEERESGGSMIQRPGITVQYGENVSAREGCPRVSVEEVTVTSPRVKTVEELWFGKKTGEETEPGAAGSVKRDFSLIDPPHGAWITLPYVFDWTRAKGKGAVYTLIIDDDADYSSPVLVKENIETSSCLLGEDSADDALPRNTELFWRVIARDDAGNESTCRQDGMSFRIK